MIVLDTSAVVAIVREEPEGGRFRERIEAAGQVLVSAGTCIELAAVAGRSETLTKDVAVFLGQRFVRIEPVTGAQAALASHAFQRWGKGHHPAALNFGDMFAYLLARELDLPLLFKGHDFARTDVRNALEDE